MLATNHHVGNEAHPGKRRIRTTDAMLENSWSGVIAADWTRNLSRHLVPGAGSCFIAWSRTAAQKLVFYYSLF